MRAYTMPMRTHLSPISQKKALGYALRPYKLWDDWINSPARPFSKTELTLIELYRKTGNYMACSEGLGISMASAANQIMAIIMRLKFQLPDYKKWEAGQKSLFEVLKHFGVESLADLRVITVNDLKYIHGEAFKITYKQLPHSKPP
jgi:hypothetical protein